jgi:penicillin-binding protein 2
VGEDAFVNYRLPDYSGIVGIEWAFDQTLRGRGGVKSVLVNSLGYRQAENVWTPAEPGKNVILTLDAEIQKAAESALTGSDPNVKGAVVIMDPNTGDVLAMVSAPAMDPNNFVPRISTDDNKKMQDSERRPMVNRAIQENYHPGSIFKIITGLACLEAGLDPAVELYVPGYIFIGRRRIEDRQAPGGFYDFRRAFLKSSNTYFISNGLHAGIQQLVKLGQKFHLGEATGIPTRQEVSGHFPTLDQVRKNWYDGDTANLCIGQGMVDVTLIQMAVMVAAIANGGKVMWPRLVARIEPQSSGSDNETIEFAAGRVRDELGVQPKNLQIIREAMLADVEDPNATGRTAAVAGMRVCGKTGTAQVTDPRGYVIDHTVWFASYAPYESPRYVVIVMVEGGSGGGAVCGPIAQKIYQALLAMEQRTRPAAAVPSVARIP